MTHGFIVFIIWFSYQKWLILCTFSPYKDPEPMGRRDTVILIKNFLTWIFLENATTCSQGSTVYQKNKNNFVGGLVMGKNRQKCQKFSLLDRFLKLTELFDQYLMHVNFSKISNFRQFFSIFNWLPLPPIFSNGDIIRYI